ncbi:unnamed protein product [Toxocara canis]|uniref:EGF-like domain-containing protein n=1 Tax=Toxocara canis TaxID=6265 RepID=A0A3P7GN60_TOXCA|nr:unnamed protein product [Toxocara canis]
MQIIEACDEKCKQSKSYCQNGGECVPEGLIIDAKTNRSALLPACHCQGLDEGLLCEDAVRSPCDKTSFDPRGPEEKCGKHGNCVAKTAYDYICEILAVAINALKEVFVWLCQSSREKSIRWATLVKCVRADFGLCKNHECKNEGKCYPCDESDLQNLQLCTDEERRRGFRCICPYGLLLPFCDKQATACTNNKCLNGAQCVVDPQNEFNYICNCRLGYSGQFCESQVSPCVVQGLKSCVMGTCVEDANFIRGFACECLEGYEGLNCDLAVRADFIGYLDRNYWWTYPLIMMLILSPIIMILSVMSENSAKREYELKKAEKERNEVHFYVYILYSIVMAAAPAEDRYDQQGKCSVDHVKHISMKYINLSAGSIGKVSYGGSYERQSTTINQLLLTNSCVHFSIIIGNS